MKKKLMIALLIGLLTGCAVQEVKIIRKLIELRKSRKETEKLKRRVEELKEKIELEQIKLQVEALKKNDALKNEIEKYRRLSKKISESTPEEELDKILTKAEDDGVIDRPWEGDFNEFMSNPDNTLHF